MTPHNGRSRPYPVPTIISKRSTSALGPNDPSLVADTPHDLWIAVQRGEPFRSTLSAADLEGWIRQSPPLRETLERNVLERTYYDDLGRLLALHVLHHLEQHPGDRGFARIVQREVGKTAEGGRLSQLVSTPQWLWALAAASRILDAHD